MFLGRRLFSGPLSYVLDQRHFALLSLDSSMPEWGRWSRQSDNAPQDPQIPLACQAQVLYLRCPWRSLRQRQGLRYLLVRSHFCCNTLAGPREHRFTSRRVVMASAAFGSWSKQLRSAICIGVTACGNSIVLVDSLLSELLMPVSNAVIILQPGHLPGSSR